jgi:hypothetical protein
MHSKNDAVLVMMDDFETSNMPLHGLTRNLQTATRKGKPRKATSRT